MREDIRVVNIPEGIGYLMVELAFLLEARKAPSDIEKVQLLEA